MKRNDKLVLGNVFPSAQKGELSTARLMHIKPRSVSPLSTALRPCAVLHSRYSLFTHFKSIWRKSLKHEWKKQALWLCFMLWKRMPICLLTWKTALKWWAVNFAKCLVTRELNHPHRESIRHWKAEPSSPNFFATLHQIIHISSTHFVTIQMV